MKKKIYLSGQITGLPLEEAASNFAAMEQRVKEQGHLPVNPLNILPYDPKHSWKDYMIADIKELFNCHAIAMHPNYEKSRGAKIELAIAKGLDLEVIYL